jgi:hypothetical protein
MWTLLTLLVCFTQKSCAVFFDKVESNGVAEGNMTKIETLATKTASPRVVSVPQLFAYEGFIRKLREKARVSSVALGGSMIVGVGCGNNPRECAYPSRFFRWLSNKHYGNDFGIAYENRAIGGSTTAAVLPMLPILVADTKAGFSNISRGVDMVLIDFSINDAATNHNVLTIENVSYSQRDRIFAAAEAGLRYILEYHPATAILMVDASCSPAVAAAHESAAALYGIPYIKNCGTGRAHVEANVHESIKNHLAEWWNAFSRRLQNQDLEALVLYPLVKLPTPPIVAVTPAGLLEHFSVCPKPLTVYDAHTAYFNKGIAPRTTKGTWALELDRDRPDKASWTSRHHGSVLEFPLKFGPDPRIALIYTKGYDNTFGSVLLTVPGAPGNGGKVGMRVYGCCDPNNVTQSELRVINAGAPRSVRRLDYNTRFHQDETHMEIFWLLPHSSATLRIEFIKDTYEKFNVKYVSSC